jgi:tetratricopeptide (TPR) repeat protein
MSEGIKELHHLVRKTVAFVERRKLLLTLVVGGALLALVVVGLGRYISRSREDGAWARLEVALSLPEGQRLSQLESLGYRIRGTGAHPWALLKLGEEYFRKQQWKLAAGAFEQAAAGDNPYVAGLAYIGLACVYEEQRDYRRARWALGRALELSKGSAMIAGRARYRGVILDALEQEAQAPAKIEPRAETGQEAQSVLEKE